MIRKSPRRNAEVVKSRKSRGKYEKVGKLHEAREIRKNRGTREPRGSGKLGEIRTARDGTQRAGKGSSGKFMDRDLIIDDDYVLKVGSAREEEGIKLEDAFTRYMEILRDIRAEALVKGEAAEALTRFTDCACMLRGEMERDAGCIRMLCESFIKHIDETDSFLY